ncbi:MAG: fatty-acyl-CoA synthase [Chloroflexota bacterium]|nr:MAG: fatty-acyl-CoA synthase [Chloroflexota bacterium]
MLSSRTTKGEPDMSELVLHGNLALNARKYRDKDALVFGDTRISHHELNARVNSLADGFLGAGLRPGDHCALLFGNSVEFVESLLALSKIGVVNVCVNTVLTPKEIAYIIDHSDSRALLAEGEFGKKLNPILGELPKLDRSLLFSANGALDGFRPLDGVRSANTAEPSARVDENAWMRLAYTSGTTGLPKGAIIPQRSQVLMFYQFATQYGLSDRDRTLIVGPMYASGPYVFGLMSLYFGGTLVLLRKFDAHQVLRTITDERVTASFMVPTMYNMMLAIPEEERRARYDVSSLRILSSGSAPRHTRTRELMFEYFSSARINDCYGTTECGLSTNLDHHDQLRKVTTVGKPVMGCEVKIVDDNNRELSPGEIGEIWVRTLSLGSGYYKNETATAKAFIDGWFVTGDLGFLDEEHFLTLVDRKNDLIISGGANVYPTDVEQALYRHPAVLEAAVVGVPDEKWGEAVKAVVVSRPGARITETELLDWCREELAGYKVPKSVSFVADLPRNAAGKVLRRVVREQFWVGRETKLI